MSDEIKWRDYAIAALNVLGLKNVNAETEDAQLISYLEEVKKGRTWECSTCEISMFSWENCCN